MHTNQMMILSAHWKGVTHMEEWMMSVLICLFAYKFVIEPFADNYRGGTTPIST